MVSALFRSQRFLSRLGLLSLAAMFLNFYETFQMWQLSLWFPLPSHQICTVQLTVVEYLPATLSCFVFYYYYCAVYRTNSNNQVTQT